MSLEAIGSAACGLGLKAKKLKGGAPELRGKGRIRIIVSTKDGP